MPVLIGKLRGLSYELQAQLLERGIRTCDELLEMTRTPAERRKLADDIGVESYVILGLANRADLARVNGIGAVFSDLLERAGVDTVKELAARRPDHLYAALVEANVNRTFAGRAPTRNAVESWVAQAKKLPAVLEY